VDWAAERIAGQIVQAPGALADPDVEAIADGARLSRISGRCALRRLPGQSG
jgi:hypothetical protein